MKIDAINIDPEIMSGTPVFRGTRVPIKTLFDYIGTGESIEEFFEGFPTVDRKLVYEVLNYAGETILSEKMLADENLA